MSVDRIAIIVVALVWLTSCTSSDSNQPDETGGSGDRSPIEWPAALADTAIVPAGYQPDRTPAQAGPSLVGTALPTNQWWTSALIGPGTEPLWAFPVIARVEGAALSVGRALVEAEPNLIRSTIVNAVTVSPLQPGTSTTTVDAYGAFSVRLRVTSNAPAHYDVSIAQGSPATWVDVGESDLVIRVAAGFTITSAGDKRWTVQGGPAGHRWTLAGPLRPDPVAPDSALVAPAGSSITIIAVPTGADASWAEAESMLIDRPVTDSTSTTRFDNSSGRVVHQLDWRQEDSGPMPVALLPHHLALGRGTTTIAGTYETARGPMSVAIVDSLETSYPMSGLIPGVPALFDPAERARLASLVEAEDLALSADGGSYWDPKLLGRLATIAEIAVAVDRPELAAQMRGVLTARLRDWFRFDGPGDARWLAYDAVWGGVVGVPPEFGNEDYNDHHFHYGYLLHAAAVVGEHDRTFVDEFAPTVRLLMEDLLGSDSASLPPLRVFNPYLGHSHASGFALVADGNNQESSSEAVHAWWAATRWSLVSGDDEFAGRALAHYVIESDAANRYWLGADTPRDPAYAHEVAGIVWSGKTDFSTFFDPHPGSIVGIQLLPFSFGSVYRADGEAARRRTAEVLSAGQRRPGVTDRWPDLFLMDLALADPLASRAQLQAHPNLEIEEGNSRVFLEYWVSALATIGRPDPTLTVDRPFGHAFSTTDGRIFVGHNPTDEPVEVVVFSGDQRLSSVELAPHASSVVRL